MNSKIVGIFICTLLIANTLVCASTLNNKADSENDDFDKTYFDYRKEKCKWGNEYDRKAGDACEYGEHDLRMGEHFMGGDATAWYKMDLLEENYILKDNSLKVGILFCDWGVIGDGPNVYIYNWENEKYILLVKDAGDHDQKEWWWYPGYINPPNDYVDNDGIAEIKIWCEDDDDTVLEKVCVRYEDVYIEPEPNLNCRGSIRHYNLKPGAKVTDSFEVENIGGPSSNLDWEIASDPYWTTFHYDPNGGTNLQPEDGPVTVNVWFYVPYKQLETWSGDIKVVNSENPSDYDYVSVSVSTPRNKQYINTLFINLLQNHPFLHQLFQLLL